MTRHEMTSMIDLIKERISKSKNQAQLVQDVKDSVWLWTESDSSIVNGTISFDIYHILNNNYFVKVTSDGNVYVAETYEEL